MEPLQEKTLALLIQLPPSLEIIPGLEGLRNLLPLLDARFRYALEVRNQSWFQDLAYNFFAWYGKKKLGMKRFQKRRTTLEVL
jgi:uncharacterized protein YecE (DUF72 family)